MWSGLRDLNPYFISSEKSSVNVFGTKPDSRSREKAREKTMWVAHFLVWEAKQEKHYVFVNYVFNDTYRYCKNSFVRISQGQVPLTKHNGIIVKCSALLVQHQLWIDISLLSFLPLLFLWQMMKDENTPRTQIRIVKPTSEKRAISFDLSWALITTYVGRHIHIHIHKTLTVNYFRSCIEIHRSWFWLLFFALTLMIVFWVRVFP